MGLRKEEEEILIISSRKAQEGYALFEKNLVAYFCYSPEPSEALSCRGLLPRGIVCMLSPSGIVYMLSNGLMTCILRGVRAPSPFYVGGYPKVITFDNHSHVISSCLTEVTFI